MADPPSAAHTGSATRAPVACSAMERLCGRPGCSELASVAYGMRPEDLVFWLDALSEVDRTDTSVLCRRHADSMVVPRGWTLDDLREPHLHLFRPPAPSPRSRPARSKRPATERTVGEQLHFDDDVTDRATDLVDVVDDGPAAVARSLPWTPSFDEADDLDGLLSADGPLLSRAFRTADRADG